MLPIHGQKDAQPHFLHDEGTIVWGVTTMLDAVAKGLRGEPGGSGPGKRKTDL